MHIGFDAKRLFFNGSGLGNYSRSTVDILCRYAPENRYTLFTPREGNACGFEIPQGVDRVMPRGAMRVVGSFWRSYALGGAIRRSGVDVYHGLSNELPADISRTRAKGVVTMHDLIFVRCPQLYKPFDRWLYIKKYGRSCRMADKIIAISRLTAEDLMDIWHIPEDRIAVIYQGCNPIFYQSPSPQELRRVAEKYRLPEHYILSVGTIEERKNLLLTVRAMAEGGVEGSLVAVGRHTPYADRVMEYARAHGVDHRIRMLHDVVFGELPSIYRQADVFVYASIYEGFGIPILEALNSGVPVVTTRGGVFGETGGDACLYVDPYCVEEMSDALIRLMGDSVLREEMKARGALHVEKFREPAIAENLMSVYRSL